jgi:hypothetical protein
MRGGWRPSPLSFWAGGTHGSPGGPSFFADHAEIVFGLPAAAKPASGRNASRTAQPCIGVRLQSDTCSYAG